ncbi:MAG: hypothetical protein WAL63_05835 [Solirubrobacteraceae bacterium]
MATAAYPDHTAAVTRRPRRPAVGVLLVLATLALLIGSYAVWIDRQLLNTDDWTNTSSQLIRNPTIRRTVSTFLVDEVFNETKLNRLLDSEPDARHAAGELRRLADGVVARELASGTARRAWRAANQVAHRELVRILDGRGTVVSSRDGLVVLNLGALVKDLAKGLSATPAVDAVTGAISASGLDGVSSHAGRIVVMRSTQLRTAQRGVKLVRGLAIVLPVAALVLFALAVWLAAGWRRVVVRRVGWCLIVVGGCVLLSRGLLEPRIVDSLIGAGWVRPAANAAWLIATSELRAAAFGTIVAGIIVVAAGWLVAAIRPARGLLVRGS